MGEEKKEGILHCRSAGIWKAVWREPLVQFASAGLVFFLIYNAIAPSNPETIRVSSEMVRSLEQDRAALLNRPLTIRERDKVIADLVDQEVLLREALTLGLHWQDGKVRQQLTEKMLFLLDEDPPEPSAQALDNFYRTHQNRYWTPLAVSFEHAFFEMPPGRPEQILATLRSGTSPTTLGERFWLGAALHRVSEAELVTVFGADFTRNVLELAAGVWHGPLRSGRGMHFVRVTDRHEPTPIPRNHLDTVLRQDWLQAWRDDMRQRRITSLRSRYQIIIEAAGGTGPDTPQLQTSNDGQ